MEKAEVKAVLSLIDFVEDNLEDVLGDALEDYPIAKEDIRKVFRNKNFDVSAKI